MGKQKANEEEYKGSTTTFSIIMSLMRSKGDYKLSPTLTQLDKIVEQKRERWP